MKNIAVSLPDSIYRRARMAAAARHTSVTALVREFVTKLAKEEPDFEERKRRQDEVFASMQEFRAADRLARSNVHTRPFRAARTRRRT